MEDCKIRNKKKKNEKTLLIGKLIKLLMAQKRLQFLYPLALRHPRCLDQGGIQTVKKVQCQNKEKPKLL
jgi:hypothetical protein